MRNLMLVLLCLLVGSFCRAEEWRGEFLEDGLGTIYQSARSENLEVYSTKVGEHRYVSYRVKWNDANVIVSDPLAVRVTRFTSWPYGLLSNEWMEKERGTR